MDIIIDFTLRFCNISKNIVQQMFSIYYPKLLELKIHIHLLIFFLPYYYLIIIILKYLFTFKIFLEVIY